MSPNPADLLNHGCRCITLNEDALNKELSGIIEERPHLFSRTMTYITASDFERMKSFITVAERVLANPEGPQGVFMGYDFHMTSEGPKLIEINTNAGGAYLNLILARSQILCCPEGNPSFNKDDLENTFLEMFRTEWRLAGKTGELRSIAIVDENPRDQYLYPEFLLFRDLFRRNGIHSEILDPSELKDKHFDLIYNRVTDFQLTDGKNQVLRELWESGKTVITPSPLHHATHAHKKHLARLSDETFLSSLSLNAEERMLIAGVVPHTRVVSECRKDDLWSERKTLFFKPVSGYGSKATYRGDKLTTKVWENIAKEEYVAQELVPPGQRVVAGIEDALKADIRAYTYRGQILLLAARLYQGQTTNFRTSGGGFSPVFVVPGKEA